MSDTRSKRVVLHITPHLGGGVGRVLLNYLTNTRDNPGVENRVISLEYANDTALAASRDTGFSLRDRMSEDHFGIGAAMAEADAVIIHWWNHPLLYDLLVREALPPCRMVFWCHVSGYHAPYVIPETALAYPDRFVFATPISFDEQDIAGLPEDRKRHLRAIWTAGGIERFLSLPRTPHPGFAIGYVGTVDYCKMHPAFLSMAQRLSIPDARFVICGGPREKQMRQESLQYRNHERLTFTGMVDDVAPYLSSFDIFGYPLVSYHYGSCEQALVEAMAAGIAPVVLNNPTERHIVKNGVTGIVAEDERGYVAAIESLYQNEELRHQLASNARNHARRHFSTGAMIKSWADLLDEILELPKTPKRWSGPCSGKTITAAQVFLESLGKHGTVFESSFNAVTEKDNARYDDEIRELGAQSFLWRADTRGTPQHYHTFFPEDPFLRRWSELLQN
jgi:glycosyltransferase involved in cell wall biosynthesis